MQMASRKRKSTASRPQEPYDTTRFVSEVAWERYEQNVHSRNILPERNVNLFVIEYDEFHQELERRQWHKALTRQPDGRIDVALVKEFYANLFDPEDKSPRQVRVRGKLIKFDGETLNEFLETPVGCGFEARGVLLILLQVLPHAPRPSGASFQALYSRAGLCS